MPLRLRELLCMVLLMPVLCPGQSRAPGASDRVAGKVVDAKTGRPLAHAQVSLEEVRSNRSVATVISGDDGSFRFDEPLAAGKYRLQGSAPGYLPSAYLQHGQLSTAIVTGAGLATEALRLSLTPAATLTGNVVDERGDPVPRATVLLFRQGTETGTMTTRLVNTRPADDDGHYEFYPVLPGRYYLAARAVPWYAVYPPQEPPGALQPYQASIDPALDVAYPTVFYPAALSQEAASPFDLGSGEQMTANMQMVPQHAQTLTLRRTGASGPPSQLIESLFGSEHLVQTTIDMSENAETIVGVAPGRYMLREFTGGSNRMPFTAGTVDLTGGSVVRDASPVPELATLTVSLRSTGPDPLPERTMVTLLRADHGASVSRPVNEKGDADFQDLPPGEYRLRVAGARRPNMPVSSMSVNGKPAPDRKVHVAGGGHLAATVDFSGLPVTVEGFAVRDGKPAAAALILLVPAEADTDAELFRRDQSDLDGSFTLPAVAPGKYLLVALDDAWDLPWTDLHALLPYLLHAQPLVVPAGAANTMRLPASVLTQARH